MDNFPAVEFQSTWNKSLSDRSAFATFWQAFQEDTLSIRKENSLDNRSVIFAILSDADFTTRFGVAKQPREHPGQLIGNRIECARFANNLTAYMLQQAIIELARKHLFKQVPAHLFEASKDNYGSLHGRSLEYLCTSLKQQVGTLFKADIQNIYAQLRGPYTPGEHIEAFVAVRRSLFRQLAAANEALPTSLKLTMIQDCMVGADFTPCWITFAKDYPLIADQTMERLYAAIITHVNIVLPITAAKVNLQIAQERALRKEMQDIKTELDNCRNQLVALKTGSPASQTTCLKECAHTDGVSAYDFLQLNSSAPQPNFSAQKNNLLAASLAKRKHRQKIRRESSAVAGIMPLSLDKEKEIPKTCQKVLAIADSGATGNYLRLKDIHVLRDVKVSTPTEQIIVGVANGIQIKSTHHGYLDVPGHGPMMAYVFPELQGSLLSMSELVNVGLYFSLCNNFITAFDKQDNMIFQGDRDVQSGLWMVDLQLLTKTQTPHQANLSVRLDSVADFVNFWHGTFGSPALSTFIPAVEKGFIRIPGLTATKIRRHPPNPLATAYGHLDATRKGLRSTKTPPAISPAPENIPLDDVNDDCQFALEKEGRMFYRTEEILSGRAHADAAGAFPVRSNSGALYQIIYYHEDTNVIHIETTHSRSGPDLLAALQRAIKFFKDHGAKPLKIVRMDNEISENMEAWLDENIIELELTPVAQHRTNRAERAIRTWKGHFIAIMAGIDPECPLSLWETFIAQAELTLNLMRVSPSNSMMSAWEMLCGRFDINSTPIAPLGMKVLVHDTPEKRGSWHAHGSLGFYTGRALKHYRCHTVWMKESRSTRISDCLSWHPVLLKMPGSSLIEELTSAVVETQRLLAKIAETPAMAHSNQPIRDDDATLAADLRSVRELFRPPSIDNTAHIEPPPGFTLQSPQQMTHLGSTAPLQRVVTQPLTVPALALPQKEPTAPHKPVVPTLQTTTVPLQRVPSGKTGKSSKKSKPPFPPATLPPDAIVLPLQINQPIRLPAKVRKHAYLNLSPQEIRQVAKLKIKRIGMQFLDDMDPNDTSTGITTSIVRHKKSRKLVYKCWDHTVHNTEPKDAASFNYIDVNYATKNCKWSKPVLVALSASITQPSRKNIKKARQRARYTPWYHRLYAPVNVSTPAVYRKFHALTALDLNADGTKLTSTSSLKGPDKLIWEKAHGEEIIRLIESGTGRFIHRSKMPEGRKAAYYNPQLKIKIMPDGTIQYRVRGTIGGDQVHYPGITTAYTAHLESIRVMLNATVSEHARIATADIKDFYLGTPLDRPEYMRISLKHIPLDVQLKYEIAAMVENDYIIMEITKGIYGLPQAGKLAQDRLVKHLMGHGYNQCVNTPCLFVHNSNGVAFTLVVDDFLIKYKEQSAVDHLLNALRELYVITTNFSDTKKYVGITLYHNTKKHYIDMSIPGYVVRACQRFQRTNLRKADSPIIYVPPRYGKFQQEVHPEPLSIPLTAGEIKELQEIVGVFLFYARAVDPTMLTAINKISSRQSKPTSLIKQEVDRFFQYANAYPDATMRIRASNMKLVCHSDGSYLSESDARSRAGGILFLGDCADGEAPNAPVAFLSVIIKTVVSSATSTEYAAAFIVGQTAIPIIHTLADLGYPQTNTEIFCDNLCAVGVANNTFTMKRTKTIDMRYHWIRDQVKLGVFKVTWKAGKLNLADFFTKAHPVHHHKSIRWKYVVVEKEDRIPSSEGVLIHA